MSPHGRGWPRLLIALGSLSLAASATLPGAAAADPAYAVAAARAGLVDGAAAGEATTTAKTPAAAARAGRIRIDVLAINDFHGRLEKKSASRKEGRFNGTPAGGVAFVARHLKRLRDQAARKGAGTLTVAAGDLIGSTPLLSAQFYDEPSIEAMNKLGLQAAAVGNHEFDQGYPELLRMQRGGCIHDGPDGANYQNSCAAHRFDGAHFQYLAANVKYHDDQPHNGRPILPGFVIKQVKGVKVGFIGLTLQDTPNLEPSVDFSGLRFTDEVNTANKLVPRLEAKGVKAIVVLLHEGGDSGDPTDYDGCPAVSGPALPIAEQLSPQIDVVISGHTHDAYNCTVRDPDGRPRLLTSAASYGHVITDVRLFVSPATGDVLRGQTYAHNVIVTNNNDGPDPDSKPDHDIRPIAALTKLIKLYKSLMR